MMMMADDREVAHVNREKLAACMTCLLCNNFFTDATTISECLHTFCKKCIYGKIIEEDLDTCPVCNIDLGCAPLDKLRADPNLQDLRVKLFPPKREKNKAPEPVPSVPLASRRKEKSLLSLVEGTPRISAKFGPTGRRSKPGPRKNHALLNSIKVIEDPGKKVEDRPEILISSETPNEIAQNNKQNPSTAESSKEHMPKKSTEENAKQLGGKADMWKSLNCLAEAARQTNSNKSNSQENVVKSAPPDAHDSETYVSNVKECGNKPKVCGNEPKVCGKEPKVCGNEPKVCGNEPKVHGNANDSTPASASSVRTRRSQGVRQKRAAVAEGSHIPAQAVVDANSKYDGRFIPLWLSLVASDDRESDAPLPQISSSYLRVKDRSLPVSFVIKYLVKKLQGLATEPEVQICLRGQPVLSTLQLHYLVDWWVQTTPTSERKQSSVGSSGEDFVMVLSYGRTAHPP